MPILPGILQAIFGREDSPSRFERLCIDLYCAAEGVDLVPTSRTWDRGRDGRLISLSGRELPGVLCATLSTELDAKLEADIRRLAETTKTKSIVYCASIPLTEDRCDKLEATVRALYPSAESVRVLGQVQLVALGERYEEVVRRHYAGEISNIEQALLQGPQLADPEHIGLRLALITQTGDDARALRREITKRLVLDALTSRAPQTSPDLAATISHQLHLGRSISANYVGEILADLGSEDLVEIVGDRVRLTPVGEAFIRTIPQEAGVRLLEGRSAIREAIAQLSGHRLTDEHYDRVWKSLQDGLSELLYSHGAGIVQMVGSLITGENLAPDSKQRLLVEGVADRLLPLFADSTQGSEVRQAVIDMFSEKGSKAFEWLTQVCSVYVMMCSLGFEALSSQEITRLLRGFALVADSDVIISLLCEGERNHDEVSRIVRNWKALGGKLLVATPVLEEGAYHAWISLRAYANIADQLGKIPDPDLDHLVGNAFVRTFARLFHGKISSKNWNRYIAIYRGDQEYDYGRLLQILREEYGFDVLPSAGEEHHELASKVMRFLIRRRAEESGDESLDYRQQDKCRRDGTLFAAVQAARQAARQAGTGGTTIVLSSSRLMRDAADLFKDTFGQPYAVVCPAAVGCLLTLTPGVSMGLGTLRGVLFDLDLAKRLTQMQRFAYQLIARSGEYDLPYSRRVTLQSELGQRLLADARARGEPVREVRDRVLRSENPEYSARIVAEALDRMAVTPETEEELARLRAEVKRLKEELARR